MNLKDYLKDEEESMAKFAQQLGVTAQYMWFLCNKKKAPSFFLAWRIEELTNKEVSMDELLGRKIPEESKPTECPKCKRSYSKKHNSH